MTQSPSNNMSPDADGTSATALFTNYINVCNSALAKHSGEFPVKQMLDLASSQLDTGRVGVAIYEDNPDAPFDYFTVRLNEQRRLELVDHGKREPELQWKAKRAYLQRVVEHPEPYIDSPLKLDWDWLKGRVRDAMPS